MLSSLGLPCKSNTFRLHLVYTRNIKAGIYHNKYVEILWTLSIPFAFYLSILKILTFTTAAKKVYYMI